MKTFIILSAFFLSLSLLSCNNENLTGVATSQNSSNISIGFSMKNAANGITKIEGILSRQGYDTLFTDFVIHNDSATASFNNIAAGAWHLQVNAYDASNILMYTGSADVEVYAGVTTPVSITLNPASGSINITVTWGAVGGENLIYNPSFEFNGQPSTAGWSILDTTLVRVVQGAPPGEGNWSLWIAPQYGPISAGGFATTNITGQSGMSNYTLSFWEYNFSYIFSGMVIITQLRKGSIIYSDYIHADTTSWSLFTKKFQLSILPTDTLQISLRSESPIVVASNPNATDSVSNGVLYDGITLIKN